MTNVSIIGLGTMGLPMAHNLLKAGHHVTGFDLTAEALNKHLEQGGSTARSAADAVKDADFIITMLPKGEHVKAAIFEGGGVLEGMADDAILIEMSTIHPLETDAIRAGLEQSGKRMIDAPVGRTSAHAITGELLIMAGGTADDLARAKPIFDCLGDSTIDCGGAGMGIRVKMINNFMSIANNVLTAEALTLAEAIGLDVNLAVDVMSGTAAGKGHMMTTYQSKALKGDSSPAFMLELAHKDIGLALDLAGAVNVPLPLGAAAREMYSLAKASGKGGQDWTTGMYQLFRELAQLAD